MATLGLDRDLEGIEAIERVEHEFGVKLDPADAPGWVTVGDVHISLLKALPDYLAKQPSTWTRMCRALCESNGSDWRRATAETLLLAS